ncbi:hypothetical protein F4778DRAFT_740561 [Xylariomycetidae sp. FL2044]|nr:hypothetical protein F4778DRAFT_740561 [Xylariomycetidae sp. FL2044]
MASLEEDQHLLRNGGPMFSSAQSPHFRSDGGDRAERMSPPIESHPIVHPPQMAQTEYGPTENIYPSTTDKEPPHSVQYLPQEGPETPLRRPSHVSSWERTKHYVASQRGNSWGWEIAALLLSTGSLAALVGVLIYADGLPLARWNFFMSLNALISTLGAVSRVSLGFAISSCIAQAKWNWFKKKPDNLLVFERIEEASRGPWGSFWLLVSGTWGMVVVGAIVTILLIAFEPFLQAIISLEGSLDPVSSSTTKASVARSDFLDAGAYFSDGTSGIQRFTLTPSNESMWFEPFKFHADLGMSSALTKGFYNSLTGSQDVASFTCSTANCTWTPFTSLAVCSRCADVTSYLTRNRTEGANLGTLSSNDILLTTNYTINALPYVDLTNPSDSTVVANMSSNATNYSAFMAATRITNPGLTINFHNLSTMITTVQVLQAAKSYESGLTSWDDTAVTATECALYFCAKLYNSSVYNTQLGETVVASWAERDPASYRNVSYQGQGDFDAFEAWNNHSLYSQLGDYHRGDLTLLVPDGAARRHGLPANVSTRFSLTEQAVGSTVRFVNEDFFTAHMAWPIAGDTSSDQPAVVEVLYASRDLGYAFGLAAQSLSNWVRGNGGSGSGSSSGSAASSASVHVGTGHEWVPHFRVKWAYVAAPVLTIALGLAFSVLSMAETRRLRLEPWKTDVVSTLTYSVDPAVRAQLRHADQSGYLGEVLRAMQVRFEDVGSGLELRAKVD